MLEVRMWTCNDKDMIPFVAYSVSPAASTNKTEGERCWAVRRYDSTDHEYYWWCLCCDSAGCDSVKAVRKMEMFGGNDPGDETDFKG